jgi:HEAT repeat protein
MLRRRERLDRARGAGFASPREFDKIEKLDRARDLRGLRRQLKTASVGARIAIVEIVGRRAGGFYRQNLEILLECVQDPEQDRQVRLAAIDAASKGSTTEAAQVLVALLRDPDDVIAEHVADSLEVMGARHESVRSTVVETLSDCEPQTARQSRVVRALTPGLTAES